MVRTNSFCAPFTIAINWIPTYGSIRNNKTDRKTAMFRIVHCAEEAKPGKKKQQQHIILNVFTIYVFVCVVFFVCLFGFEFCSRSVSLSPPPVWQVLKYNENRKIKKRNEQQQQHARLGSDQFKWINECINNFDVATLLSMSTPAARSILEFVSEFSTECVRLRVCLCSVSFSIRSLHSHDDSLVFVFYLRSNYCCSHFGHLYGIKFSVKVTTQRHYK